MARSVNKKPSKPAQAAINSTNSTASGPPKSFEFTNPDFARLFLSGLPQSHIYLVHVDNTSPLLKRRVFLVPVCMNLIILAALALRLYYAAPTYLNLIITVYGFDFTGRGQNGASLNELLYLTATRFLLFLLDYIIFFLLGSWPWEFMFGNKYNDNTGPFSWRKQLGFQPREIIVRRSRAWDRSLMENWNLDSELTLKYKVVPAMEDRQLAKTGYLLLDKDWDLDFGAILKAHRLVDSRTLQISDFEPAAFVYHQKQWIMWRMGKPGSAQVDPGNSPKMKAFKEKLTALGREDVFFRWIEIVQFESSVPGGFTEGRKAAALRELSALLSEKGIDYARFVDDLGGSKNLPGMEEE